MNYLKVFAALIVFLIATLITFIICISIRRHRRYQDKTITHMKKIEAAFGISQELSLPMRDASDKSYSTEERSHGWFQSQKAGNWFFYTTVTVFLILLVCFLIIFSVLIIKLCYDLSSLTPIC
jgi:heme/copper-type cytochrome/quinol oxidase subunit 2